MITLGGQKVKVEDIKQFFYITKSTPKYLIEWLKETMDYMMPCFHELYRGKFFLDIKEATLWGDPTNFSVTGSVIHFPSYIRIYTILINIKEKENFKKFKKALSYFERKYMKQTKGSKRK
jgi:hypothetical protein